VRTLRSLPVCHCTHLLSHTHSHRARVSGGWRCVSVTEELAQLEIDSKVGRVGVLCVVRMVCCTLRSLVVCAISLTVLCACAQHPLAIQFDVGAHSYIVLPETDDAQSSTVSEGCSAYVRVH
jgi:hypothetical protein